MKRGDRVKYMGSNSDFFDKEGVIIYINSIDNIANVKIGTTILITGIDELELSVITEDQPSFDRTAIATQILSGMMPQRQTIQIHNKKEEIVAAAIELTDELIKQLSACQN